MNYWKLWHPNIIASISFSIWAWLTCALVNAFDAYATAVPFCMSAAPSPNLNASTEHFTGCLASLYLSDVCALFTRVSNGVHCFFMSFVAVPCHLFLQRFSQWFSEC